MLPVAEWKQLASVKPPGDIPQMGYHSWGGFGRQGFADTGAHAGRRTSFNTHENENTARAGAAPQPVAPSPTTLPTGPKLTWNTINVNNSVLTPLFGGKSEN